MTGAAFFDLDRTLLKGASGPLISQALRDAGVVSQGPLPGEALVYKIFDLIGETRPSIMLARQAARVSKGWSQAEVREAGAQAADGLTEVVQPFALPLIEEHCSEGRQVVLATTTPHDVIEALAKRLGFDAVVATRYGLDSAGCFDGTIDGEFVWGRGKLRAVQAWADDHGVDLAASWAYSDSFYDAPLLGAVGNPVAVNPDPRLAALALLRRWRIVHFDLPDGVPKLPLLRMEPYKVLQQLVRPGFLPWVRLKVSGIEHIPERGPGILVSNHRSYFDPLALGMAFAKRGRPVRFLGKREVFDAPVVGQVVRALGAIPVDRGGDTSAALVAAERALVAGELVVVLPQGTIPRGDAFFEPKLRGRLGAARLAASTGAPVIPFGLWGTEKVWPRAERVPRVWNVVNPPTVTVRGGPPVELKHRSPKADTERIMQAITDLLPP